MQRDLSVAAHPILTGRSWPAKVHHWTYAEFEAFLARGAFPYHTWNDQQNARKRAARDALVKGQWVPEAVLAEAPEVVADAEMLIASEEAAKLHHAVMEPICEAMVDEFELETGFTFSAQLYADSVKSIIQDLLIHGSWKDLSRGSMSVKYGKWDLTLRILEGQPPTIGAFGAYGGRDKVVDVVGGKSGYRFSLHRIMWPYAETAIRELLEEGSISYDQLWFWTEVGYQPPYPLQVTKVESFA